MPEKKDLGVSDLAKHMKLAPATVRVLLRENKVKKDGKSYVWSSATAMQAVAKKLGRTSVSPPKKKGKSASVAAAA